MERLRNQLERLRSSLWLIPAAMAAAAFFLAYAMLVFDLGFGGETGELWWLFSGDAGTARDLLATLLSGMITMTSLVVSITMVVLSLAAGQLGPRLIWIFIRDRQIQLLLGFFIATILYLLVVLRSLGGELGREGVPHLAVTLGSALSILCLFFLLFHVHKVSRLIIADTVVRAAAAAFEDSIRGLAEAKGEEPVPLPLPETPYRRPVTLGRRGYVQVIDYEALCRLAEKRDLTISVRIRAGDFVLRGLPAMELRALRDLPDELLAEAARACVIGEERSPAQDLEYSIRQLVEVAVRALSPGINDPFTAISVVHRLGAALESIGERLLAPRQYCAEEGGRLLLEARISSHAGLVDAAFDQIRQAARDKPAVLIEIARSLRNLGLVVTLPSLRQALASQARVLQDTGRSFIPDPYDREDFAAEVASALQALEGSGPGEKPGGNSRA